MSREGDDNFTDVKLEMADQSAEAPPPTYAASKNDKPPDYDSIFGRVQSAKDESTGNVDFAQKVVALACCGTICSLINLTILFTLPIVNLVIGIVYLDDCPIEKYIPIYLVVAGVFGILKGVLQTGLLCMDKLKESDDEDETKKNRPNPVDQIINCFLFAWFIAGSVWVYSNHTDVQHHGKHGDNYCHEVCYKYAFWFITITYIFLALGLICCCAGMIVACMVACKSKD